MQLRVEGLPQAWTDVQQRQKTRRVQTAAVSQPRADEMIVIRRNGFQHVQQVDGMIQHLGGAPHQASRVREIAAANMIANPLQFPRRTFEQQLRSLMHYLESQFIWVQEFL